MDRMTVVMLEAISQMLEECKDVKVQCAKIMLDKILNGIPNLPNTFIPISTAPSPYQDVKPTAKIKEPEDQYLFTADKGALKEIKRVIRRDEIGDVVLSEELEPFALVELDGRTHTYEEAKGKKFNTGKVL